MYAHYTWITSGSRSGALEKHDDLSLTSRTSSDFQWLFSSVSTVKTTNKTATKKNGFCKSPMRVYSHSHCTFTIGEDALEQIPHTLFP